MPLARKGCGERRQALPRLSAGETRSKSGLAGVNKRITARAMVPE
jgi:hypothetical protein